MKRCVFAGPTLAGERIDPAIARFEPAALGSVFRAVEAGYRRIGIVDGYFGNVPSVWHKEILHAIASGAEVIGAASMGALRAAELSFYGMRGIGRIYRLYRSGLWTDDDEVAVIHATAELAFVPLSDAMANIRFTLRRLKRAGALEPAVEQELARRMKALHFSERTREAIAAAAATAAGASQGARLMQRYAEGYVDIKKQDALALIAALGVESPLRPATPAWQFPQTGHWRRQFEREIDDVPALR